MPTVASRDSSTLALPRTRTSHHRRKRAPLLIELKDATAAPASVFYSPLQLLQYAHEWAAAFEAVSDQLATRIKARIGLGLSPSNMPSLGGGLRPVVCFGKSDAQLKDWK